MIHITRILFNLMKEHILLSIVFFPSYIFPNFVQMQKETQFLNGLKMNSTIKKAKSPEKEENAIKSKTLKHYSFPLQTITAKNKESNRNTGSNGS